MSKRYQPTQRLGRLAVLCVAGGLLLSAGDMVVSMQQSIAPDVITAAASSSEAPSSPLAALKSVLLLLGSLVFLGWLQRACDNLDPLGVKGQNYTKGWQLLGFIIPILSFFRPVQIMSELWRASDPQAAQQGEAAWKLSAAPSTIKAWWSLVWVNALVGAVAAAMNEGFLAFTLMVISQVAWLVAGVLLIQIIRGVDVRQAQLAGQMKSA